MGVTEQMQQATAQKTSSVVERFMLKAFREACLVLEEGVASLKDIETGMITGAGILPGPFARADETGLDEMLASLERDNPLLRKHLLAAVGNVKPSHLWDLALGAGVARGRDPFLDEDDDGAELAQLRVE